MEIVVNKLATRKQRQEAQYWCSLINNELTVMDYVFFSKLQQQVRYIIEEAETAGIYKQKDKQLLNTIKKETDLLIIACSASEKVEFSNIITCTFPNYRFAYMNEGGYFFQKIVNEWNKMTNEHYVKLHYAVGNIFNKYTKRIKYVEFSVRLYEMFLTLQILDAIIDFFRKKLKHFTGVNITNMKMSRHSSVEGKLKQLVDKYIGNSSLFCEQDRFAVQNGGQAILNISTHDEFGRKIGKTLQEAIEDYSRYCIAAMIAHVRMTGNISTNDRNSLVEMGFENDFIDKMVDEFKKTHVCEKESDIMEIKDSVYRIKYKKHLNMFIKAMTSVTKEIKEAV